MTQKSVKTGFCRAAAAGLLICMGCIVNLKAGGGIPGAVLFSAGLWFVVNFDDTSFRRSGRRPRRSAFPTRIP